jgi:hypothetical protein
MTVSTRTRSICTKRKNAGITRRATFTMALIGLAGAAHADNFAPGAWQHRTTTISADVPGIPQWIVKMFAGNSSRKSCLSAADSLNHPEALLTQDDAAVCKLRHISLTGGKLVFDTFCTNKRFPDGLLIASRGTYTPNSYALSTITTGTRDGKPVKIVTTGSGQRTGTCR